MGFGVEFPFVFILKAPASLSTQVCPRHRHFCGSET
jgi:hypothetical protein